MFCSVFLSQELYQNVKCKEYRRCRLYRMPTITRVRVRELFLNFKLNRDE